MKDFFELLERHEDQKVAMALDEAKRKVKQETINAMINIICEQSKLNVMAAFFGGSKAVESTKKR